MRKKTVIVLFFVSFGIIAFITSFFMIETNRSLSLPSSSEDCGFFQRIWSGCEEKDALKKVFVITLMSHPSLDTVIENMKIALSELGYIEGESIEYNMKNANGDQNAIIPMLTTIGRSDMVVAITTPVAQMVTYKVYRIPIVFSAVTDPVGSGIINSMDLPLENITGVSDAWPYESQFALMREIMPDARNIGVPNNPGDSASQYGMNMVQGLAPKYGFDITEIPAFSTAVMYGNLRTFVREGELDAIYIISDNTVISGFAAILKIASRHDLPIFAGDSGTVEQGAVASVSVGYSGVGRITGELVARTLQGETHIPVQVIENGDIILNLNAAKEIGLDIPPDVLARAAKVFGDQ